MLPFDSDPAALIPDAAIDLLKGIIIEVAHKLLCPMCQENMHAA